MMTAASVAAQFLDQDFGRQGAGQHRQHVVAPGHGFARRRPAARHAGDARHDGDREALLQPDVKMHEGAIEKRVALAQDRHVAPEGELDRDGVRRLLVKGGKLAVIVRIGDRNFRRHRIMQRHFLGARRDPAVDDSARIAAPSRLGEIGDDRRGLDHPHRLHRQEFGIARSETHAVEAPIIILFHSPAR